MLNILMYDNNKFRKFCCNDLDDSSQDEQPRSPKALPPPPGSPISPKQSGNNSPTPSPGLNERLPQKSVVRRGIMHMDRAECSHRRQFEVPISLLKKNLQNNYFDVLQNP